MEKIAIRKGVNVASYRQRGKKQTLGLSNI